MEIFILSFLIMVLVVAMMAIGYIFHRKKIKGSCGGLTELGLEKLCDCDEPCDKRKEFLAKLADQEKIELKNIEHD
ncbi:MAG: (Na+)-NQR maturation NqrM [Enterobacterales bacterium]|nr:(Na+)-NQR maturation NqrM [Enterobacterales bacterium]